MQETSLRIVLWGCGLMGQILIKYLQEKGLTIVGVIDHNAARVGKDAGEVAGLQQPLGLAVRHPEEAEQVMAETNPNVCILCTRSSMADLYEPLAAAARHGVNAITIGEEAFYPWTTSRELSRQLDELAKAHNCTLTASGFQDVFCGYLVTALTKAAQRIDRIEIMTRYNVDEFGAILAEQHGVGLTLDAFQREIASDDTAPFNWQVNEWLCARLGWTIRTQNSAFRPITHTASVHSTSLERDIPAGDVTGMQATVTTETEEGPLVETHTVGKVYAPGEADVHEVSLVGEPSIALSMHQPAIPQLTCATVVSRLGQLLESPAGLITTDKIPLP